MTNIAYNRKKTDAYGTFSFEYRRTVSGNSPRVNGKIVLRSNTLDHRKTNSHRNNYGNFPFVVTPIDSEINGGLNAQETACLDRLATVALQKFTSKVKKHNASLGVTLASWRQARDMLTSRTQSIADRLTAVEKNILKMPTKQQLRLGLRNRASEVLEYEYGWKPLVDDIQKAFDTLGRERPDSSWVSATARGSVENGYFHTYPEQAYDSRELFSAALSCNVGGRVKVTNPNLWLANQLGLLNLPGVALDLIPWSFLVGMFVNIQQIANSLTDFVGLEIDNVCTTKSAWIERTFLSYPGIKPQQPKFTGLSEGNLRTVYKERRVSGSVPTPSIIWKCPDLNFELLLTMTALVTQKATSISRIIKPRLI